MKYEENIKESNKQKLEMDEETISTNENRKGLLSLLSSIGDITSISLPGINLYQKKYKKNLVSFNEPTTFLQRMFEIIGYYDLLNQVYYEM